MVEVYYYIPAGEVNNAVDCGLKLSIWYEKEIVIEGSSRKCIIAFLNPKDDMEKYMSNDYRCVKLEVATNYCYVADRYLYQVGLSEPRVMDLYIESIIPVQEYIFGSYRLPECLVTSTVIGGHISPLNKSLDSPVLFNNSEELYISNIIETHKEGHCNFMDDMLYYFYCNLAMCGKFDKYEDGGRKIAAFIDKRDGKAYTIKIPEIGSY
jgi:hypothetical protein